MFGSCKIFARNTPLLQNILQELYSVWANLVHNVLVIALHVSDSFLGYMFSSTKMQEYSNTRLRTKRFCIGSEIDKNALTQTDDIITLDKTCFNLHFFSDKSSDYKTMVSENS